MRTDSAPAPTRLKDYAPYPYAIDNVALDFALGAKVTTVRSRLAVRRKGKIKGEGKGNGKVEAGQDLVLNGEDITLLSVAVDGKILPRSAYQLTQTHLILSNLPEHCTVEIESRCAPADNTQLMGLYVSGGRFCTQCEAEGFRRITFFPDRPDVLSVFTVRMSADKAAFPTLLANGNLTQSGELAGGQHFAVWEDPFPKPCYLFALVAGTFDNITDRFVTQSGRDVRLDVYVDPGDARRAEYAMDALKRSMRWDEIAFGREYDLDRFMIVAVRDFNFGAMENKGLNIFNSALLLADAQSATDMNFERIESVVAHEYFHNWTGNRITCRDWFQLCLKEGFTVYRDQEFSAHERGAAIQRIKDVKALRARQFPEDAGPLAHPVRPSQYLKIDNFYTATIYEKGAELIRMLHTLLGAELFRKSADLYFERLDGTAATVEQFLNCFEEASGRDLSQFMLWYNQAGTPRLSVRSAYDEDAQTLTLLFHQSTDPTPGQMRKLPLLMPVALALIDEAGHVFAKQTFALKETEEQHVISGVKSRPVISMLRGFSAPVVLDMPRSAADAAHLMAHDTDLFSRWEAGQSLARTLLSKLSTAIQSGEIPKADPALRAYCRALHSTLIDPKIDRGFKALALSLPEDGEILQMQDGADPLAITQALALLRRAVADECQVALKMAYDDALDTEPFSADAASASRRALKNTALSLLSVLGTQEVKALARAQFETASNMTDELFALIVLGRMDTAMGERAGAAFFDKWQKNPLVIDKWFAVQSARTGAGALDAIHALLSHPAYETGNPNRVRALVGGFAMSNPQTFHAFDGSGYRFFADRVLEMDQRNPGVAARLLGVFETWTKLDGERQGLITSELKRIIAAKPSKNVMEIATKSLGR